MSRRLTGLALLLVLVVALAFRLPLLDTLPPGLNFDEGGEGVAALDVSQGIYRVMWPIGGGKEPLMAYLVQPLFWLFGPTRLALRLYSALWGVAAVLATYFLASQLFPSDPESDQKTTSIQAMIPLWAALGLATAFWHVAYSRIAFRALSNPAVEALALAFLWQALRTHRWRHFVLAGFFTGGLIYTYLAGRFVPIALTLFFAVEAGLAWQQSEKPLLVQHWRKLAAMVGVAFLVFLPMGLFFLQNPSAFAERASAVSIFSPAMNQGDFWGTLWRTTTTTLGTFLSLTGDPNPLGNIPGRPELSLLLAICFVFGVITALLRWRRLPYLFLIIWWPVMLLPAILAPEDAPHHLRLIGTAPGTYTFVALGLSQLLVGVLRLWQARGVGETKSRHVSYTFWGWIIALLVFGGMAIQTYQAYFVRWASEIDHYLPFDMYAEDLANEIIANTDPTTTYVIPMDLRAAHEARHYSLDFLAYDKGQFAYLVVDEGSLAAQVTQAAEGKRTLKMVRWIQDKHQEADAKEMVTFLLDTAGAVQQDESAYLAYLVETYQLPAADTQFAFPEIEQSVDATLDGLIQIRWATIAPSASGQAVAVGVTYAPIAPIEVDYRASLRLVGPDGAVVAQKDRTLLHNWHQPTSLWPREEVNEYYLLPLPPDVAAGLYIVRAVIYHPETQMPLTMNGQAEIVLGQIALEGGGN